MHLVRSRKMEKVISVISSLFLIFGAVITAPFSIKDTYAAEIGAVGLLAGETTLWEIAGTLFAGAGLILANNDIQQSAMEDLGSNSYTLDSLVQSGKINVPEGGSSALNPDEWDWSGLENDLANNTSTKDRKIIEGVFGQTGNNSPSGGNDNDPWYKKFVRWVKAGVYQGAYLRNQYINSNNGQIELGLAYLSQALSSYLQSYVTNEVPVTQYNYSTDVGAMYYIDGVDNTGSWRMQQIEIEPVEGWKYFVANTVSEQDAALGRVYIKIYILNVSGQNKPYGTFIGTYDSQLGVDGEIKEKAINLNRSTTINNGNYISYPFSTSSTSQPTVTGYYPNSRSEFGSTKIYKSYGDDNIVDVIQEYIDNGMVNTSPDIMTPLGPAVNTPSTTWVPTPYLDDDEHIEILPQTQINTYINTITNPEIEPTPNYIAEVWTNTVNPFVGEGNADPQPSTVPNPNITTVPKPNPNPNVTPIPDVEPGGNDNPITVTNPDPMPVIEGGNADLPQIWDFFPFCIPSDVIEIYKLFEVENDARQAPVIDWRFQNATFGIDYTFHLDFSIFDSVAAIGRTLFLLLFIMTLLVGTRNLIWR